MTEAGLRVLDALAKGGPCGLSELSLRMLLCRRKTCAAVMGCQSIGLVEMAPGQAGEVRITPDGLAELARWS